MWVRDWGREKSETYVHVLALRISSQSCYGYSTYMYRYRKFTLKCILKVTWYHTPHQPTNRPTDRPTWWHWREEQCWAWSCWWRGGGREACTASTGQAGASAADIYNEICGWYHSLIIYMYVQTEREREREREKDTILGLHVHLQCTWIHSTV